LGDRLRVHSRRRARARGRAGATRCGSDERASDLQVQSRRQAAVHTRETGRRTRPRVFLPAERNAHRAERDIFVSEGHSSQQGSSTARVLKFDKSGKLLGAWGTVFDSTTKDQPYSFNQPHALAMDSKGRLFVGDRGYNRIKIFTQDGKLLDTWYQFSRPSGVVIDKSDNIYVGDSESGSVNPPHGAWKRGIRIGSAKDGSIVAFIPDPNETAGPGQTSAAEGIAVDSKGVIYGAEVGQKDLKRYEKKP
jgi:hypothetical protein